MQVTISCPSCRQPISVFQATAGQVFSCPHCQQPFTVPLFVPPPAPLLEPPENPLANLNDDRPVSRRSHRGRHGGEWSFPKMVAAIVLALVLVIGVLGGGWYGLIYLPERHELECDYSRSHDGYDKAYAEQKHELFWIYSNEIDQRRERFFAKYKQFPQYIPPERRMR